MGPLSMVLLVLLDAMQALAAYGASPATAAIAPAQLPHTHWRYWLYRSADNFSGNKPSGYDITSLRLNLLQQLYMSYPAAFHYPDPSAPEEKEGVKHSQKREQKESIEAAVTAILTVNPNTPDNPRMGDMVQDVLQQLLDIFKYGSQQVFLNHVSLTPIDNLLDGISVTCCCLTLCFCYTDYMLLVDSGAHLVAAVVVDLYSNVLNL